MSKGVSEIVATVLMILIVSTIGLGVFLYSMGYFSGITSARYEATKVEINAILENFRIVDAVFVKGATSEVSLAVYNYGNVGIDLAAIYVNGTPLQTAVMRLEPKQTGWFNGTYIGEIGSGPAYVRIATLKGSVYEEVFLVGG
ncbi:MAG: hypothetical protein H5T32_06890 [Candidatus Methanosuratus sp.]|nr:hypothetical protein [Candidatus Methanosuratincola sp.]